MTPELAAQIWSIVGIYLAIGLGFALLFSFVAVGGIDPDAKRMKLSVRLLIIPGTALLWPFMLIKTVLRKGPPVQ